MDQIYPCRRRKALAYLSALLLNLHSVVQLFYKNEERGSMSCVIPLSRYHRKFLAQCNEGSPLLRCEVSSCCGCLVDHWVLIQT